MARPKLTEGTQKSITEIQKDSDDKRGLKVKGFKIPLSEHEFIDNLAKQHALSNAELLLKAMHHYADYLASNKAD